MTGEQLKKNLEVFLSHIESINDTLPMAMLLIQPYSKKSQEDFFEFIKNNVKEIEDDKGEKKILVKTDEVKVFETLEKNATISSLAIKILPESLFVSLISQYDAFLSRLLKAIFDIKPDILNGTERNLSFSQLNELKTIEHAKNYIVEKEVESVLRKSHSEQFDYLEKKVGIKLRENLPIWQTFIEITERRNLFVHCDGIISSQYLTNLKEHSCSFENCKKGDRLTVSPVYFRKAYQCLYEISVKLTHTLWRKLISNDLKAADRELNDTCYNLISNKSFEMADILLEFAYSQRRFYNDAFKNVFVINSALSKYLQNKKSEAKDILAKKDWSACSDDFKLANAILTENYDETFNLMKKIGDKGEVDKFDYKEWPLFYSIRKKKEFKETYKEIFNEEYSVLETPMRPLQELISKEIKTNKDLKSKIVKRIESRKKLADD